MLGSLLTAFAPSLWLLILGRATAQKFQSTPDKDKHPYFTLFYIILLHFNIVFLGLLRYIYILVAAVAPVARRFHVFFVFAIRDVHSQHSFKFAHVYYLILFVSCVHRIPWGFIFERACMMTPAGALPSHRSDRAVASGVLITWMVYASRTVCPQCYMVQPCKMAPSAVAQVSPGMTQNERLCRTCQKKKPEPVLRLTAAALPA